MRKILKCAAKEFCSSTGLHGYRFLVIPKRILFERIIWITILTTSVITAIVISLFAWADTTQQALVKTVTDSTHYPIWNYQFPAVTMCNFNQISKSKSYEMAKHIKRPSDMSVEDLVRDFRYLIELQPTGSSNIPQWNLTRLQDILDQNNIAAEHMFQKLAPNCTEMLQRCKWKGEENRCEVLFEQIKTNMGFCCSFNYYAIKNHRFSGALPNKTPPKPRKLSGCGYKTALEVVVDNKPNDYFATDIASYGYRILIHHPYNFPDSSMHNMWLGMKLSMFIGVSPVITKCNGKPAELSIKDRNCLFANEKNLHSFRHYTHHNCLTECRIKIMVRLCGCIPFYLYNENGTLRDNKICNLRDNECLAKHRSKIVNTIPGTESKFEAKNNPLNDKLDKCTCLPDCEYSEYPFECSSGEFSRKYASNGQRLFSGIKIENQSVVRVFFNDLVAVKNTRVLRYYWHTLFALFGGLLSLFTGFSFGSAFELVYFFIIRLALKAFQRRYLKNRKLKENKITDGSVINKNLICPALRESLVTSISLQTPTKVRFKKNFKDFKKNVPNNSLPFVH